MRDFPGLACVCALIASGAAGSSMAAVPAQPPSNAAVATAAVLQKVCLPLIQGQRLKDVAPSVGLRKDHGAWVLRIDRDRRVKVTPPDPTNPHVCQATIVHGLGAGPTIRAAVDEWARSRTPPLTPGKVDSISTGPQYQHTTSTWDGQASDGTIGVVLSEEKTLAGAPVDGRFDQAELLVSLTPQARGGVAP